ncbi:MAG TPA: MinD/ParA family protein [Leptospiraceae bacterium]|nr:MinD/ParA family protein [Leptospiraceae bacterium]HMW05065.1 MinD/ParA family protein [Leptospiraceae bacterium]HMX35492.1 MinD/ParA family protein [Leptospiraceae bacterium]HMY31638.1 MinD/ParA family protein [Leptospiraceae bacterium]HMZ62618.1 MinD/ParA family protein [Leptospiraceae bacterium]
MQPNQDVLPNDEFPAQESDKRGSKIIAISSGKGGVGKTVFTVNLAVSLAKAGKKVLVIDGDLGLGNVNVLFGFIPKFNLYHVMKGHRSIRDIVFHTPEGVDVIPGSNGYPQFANLDDKSRDQLIQSFSQLDAYDYVLVDTGAGIGPNVIGFTLYADEVILVVAPDPSSVTDAYGLIKSLISLDKKKKISFIVNKIRSEAEGKKVVKRITEISNKFLGIKPISIGFLYQDEDVDRSVRKQKPFLLFAPRCKAAENLYEITGTIANIPIDPYQTQPKMMVYFKKFLSSLIPNT